MALRDLGEIDVGVENVILAGWCSRHHPPIRCADKRLSGKIETLLAADPIAERGEIPVLEGRDP